MPSAMSLFAGCGGCSLGLNRAGIDVVCAADSNSDACHPYTLNLAGTCYQLDLSVTSPQMLLARAGRASHAVDLIVGGPPCQGFSSAGARDWNDPRSLLLKRFVEIVIAIRPTWFIMENVEGLLTASDGFFIIEAIARFLQAGYWIRTQKVYMEEYGLPQKRKRVFMVGNLETCAFDFPEPTHRAHRSLWEDTSPLLTLAEALDDLPIAGRDAARDYEREPTNPYQSTLRRSDGLPILHHQAKHMNDLTQRRIAMLQPGETMKHLPEHLQHPSFSRRALRRVMDGTPTERRGGAPAGLKRLYADQPALTITSAAPTEFVHPIFDRLLTLRECARLQSFPDWFEFVGSWNAVATQIGNAIPPLFMEHLARHIAKQATWRKIRCGHGRWLGMQATKSSGVSPALARMLHNLDEKTACYAG